MALISKQSLRSFWEDFKIDMFSYKAVKEAPVSRQLTEKLDAVLQQENSAEKVDQLLAMQEDTEKQMKSLARPQMNRMLVTGGLLVAGVALGGLVGTAGGAVAVALFYPPLVKYMLNNARSVTVNLAIKDKTNAEVQDIGDANPNHVFSSPKVQQRLVSKGYLREAFRTEMDEPAKRYERVCPKEAGFQIKLKQEP